MEGPCKTQEGRLVVVPVPCLLEVKFGVREDETGKLEDVSCEGEQKVFVAGRGRV
jgi:hypothetical protein